MRLPRSRERLAAGTALGRRGVTTLVPHWLHVLAIVSLVLAVASAIVVVVDEAAGQRQHMAVMNVVWPLPALWAGALR